MGRKVNKTGCMTQKSPKYKPFFAIPSASMIIRTGYFVSKRYCSNFRIITATLRWPIFQVFYGNQAYQTLWSYPPEVLSTQNITCKKAMVICLRIVRWFPWDSSALPHLLYWLSANKLKQTWRAKSRIKHNTSYVYKVCTRVLAKVLKFQDSLFRNLYLSHIMTKLSKSRMRQAKTDQPRHPPSLIRVFTVWLMGS